MADPRVAAVAALNSADAFLEAFEDAWSRGETPRIESFLPPSSQPALRRSVLEELLKIDINWRWSSMGRGGARLTLFSLEDYCRQFPELGGMAELPDSLIGEDYRAMNRWGSAPEHGSYLARFADRAPRLRLLLQQIDRELAKEFANRPPTGRLTPPAALPYRAVPILTLPEFIRQVRSLELVEPAVLDTTLKEPGAADAHALARTLVARNCLTPYQVNLLLRGRGQELVIGQYVLLDRLGQGGMGKVFKAVHRGMRRLVALKVIRPDLMLNEEVVTRFYREIRLVGQFSHPNIVHAYDAGPVGTLHALAMEYVEGPDLARYVKRWGPLDVGRACHYVRQAADGLQYAFERGLVHRDIKPHNLLLAGIKSQEAPIRGPGGESGSVDTGLMTPVVKILDLGLARLQRPDSGNSSMVTPTKSLMVGTPDFLAPEQAVDFHAADTRSDIYSLGCTLFFLMTGEPPFSGGTIAEKLLRHQMAEPPRLAERTGAPPELERVFRRMMAKRPDERFQTPWEVSAALAIFCHAGSGTVTITDRLSDTVEQPAEPFSDLEIALEQPPTAELVPTASVRYRLGIYAGIALAVLLAAGVVALPWLFNSMKPRSAPVVLSSPKSTPTELAVADDPFFKGLLAYWRMDDGRGNRVADASGRGNHATIRQASWAPGIRGKAIRFESNESYLDYGASPDFNFGLNTPFTFAGWIKTTGRDGAIISQRNDKIDGSDIDIELINGVLFAIVRTDAYIAANVGSTTPISDGRWHHFALTRSAKETVALYVDGHQTQRVTVAGVGGPITTNLRAVGNERYWAKINYNKPPQYRGSTDEICIFARELNAEEIQELMRRTGAR
jgi:serine/threonine-protein kinase